LRLHFDVSDRLLDVLQDGIPIVHVKEGQEISEQPFVLDSGGRGTRDEPGPESRQAGLVVGATREPRTGVVLAPVSATHDLMLGSFVHPKVKKTLAMYRGVKFGTLLQGDRWAACELQLRLRFDNSDRLLDVLLGGISIIHVKEDQESSDQLCMPCSFLQQTVNKILAKHRGASSNCGG
jgi:hypothetical protein